MRSIPPVALPSSPSSPLAEPETLDQLIRDCRQMAEHWTVPAATSQARVAPASLRGITVPPASAHVVDGMAEFGA